MQLRFRQRWSDCQTYTGIRFHHKRCGKWLHKFNIRLADLAALGLRLVRPAGQASAVLEQSPTPLPGYRRPAAGAPSAGPADQGYGTDGGGPVRRRSWRCGRRGSSQIEQRSHDHRCQVSATASIFTASLLEQVSLFCVFLMRHFMRGLRHLHRAFLCFNSVSI